MAVINMRPLTICAGAVCAVIVLVSGCSRSPYRIGFSATLSGKNADLGLQSRNGAILALEEINSTGGINGRNIEIEFADDENDQSRARDIDLNFYDKGINVIIGHGTSNMTKAGLDALADKNILMISPSASSSYFSDKDDNLIRVCAINKWDAFVISDYLIEKKKMKALVVYDISNKVYTLDIISNFTAHYTENGGGISETLSFNSAKNGDVDRMVDAILKSGADSVFLSVSAFDLALIAQHLHQKGYKGNLYSGGWAMTDFLIRTGGRSVEGIILSQFFDSKDSSESYMSFKRKYVVMFSSEPTFASVYGYDCVILLAEALRRVGGGNASEIKAEILRMRTFRSAMGDLMINKYGDSLRKSYLFRIENGQFVKMK